MNTVICYTEDKKIKSMSFTKLEEAMMWAEILFNTGDYKTVKVFDMMMSEIYSF